MKNKLESFEFRSCDRCYWKVNRPTCKDEMGKVCVDFRPAKMGCHLEKFAKSWNSPVMESKDKRIAELEAALQVEKSSHEETKYADSEAANQAFSRIAKQRAALKKLGQAKRERGKALVEERARGNYFDESQECEGYWWDRKNTDDCTQNQYREVARDQLRREKLL
jgi:hypothetical protein